MATTEREKHIKNLIALKDFCNNNGLFILASNIEQSLDYAISSLKTDLKYDLMYEGENVYTKADVVVVLEDLKQDIIAEAYGIETDCSDYVVNVADIDMVIQQKINSLNEEKK